VPGGSYLGPDGPGERAGHPVVVTPPPAALDDAVARRLWDVSEELTGTTFGLPAPSAPAVASFGCGVGTSQPPPSA
jgi:hypothetical protein